MKWIAKACVLATRRMARTHLSPAVAATLLMLSLGVSAPAEAATYDITVGPGPTYSPSSLTIQVGDMVKFDFVPGTVHTVTHEASGDACLPASPAPLFDFSSTSTYTFSQPGTYPFMCTVPDHCVLGQHGVIEVLVATPAQPSTWGQLKAHYR